MLQGIMAGGNVMLVDEGGKPIQDTPVPDVPDGWEASYSWEDQGGVIAKTWKLAPKEGTVQDAAVELARIQALSLTDDQALKVPALYPQWDAGGVAYAKGDRLVYAGKLYKVLQAHTSQADWTPPSAPSLFAPILPGQTGDVGEWEQPDSTNPYMKGDRVTHNGKTWESDVDDNVWEPGTTGSHWNQIINL